MVEDCDGQCSWLFCPVSIIHCQPPGPWGRLHLAQLKEGDQTFYLRTLLQYANVTHCKLWDVLCTLHTLYFKLQVLHILKCVL